MSTPNEQDETFVSLADLALGLLPAAEAARLMAIVQTSPELQAELASLRGATNALGHGVAAAPMAADRKAAMRERLLRRAIAGPGASDASGAASAAQRPGTTSAPIFDATFTSVPRAAPPSTPSLRLEPRESRTTPVFHEVEVPARLSLVQRVSPFLALAATAAFGLAVFRLQDTLQRRNDAEAALRVATVAEVQLRARVAESESLVEAMSGSAVRVVDMVSTQQQAPGARMFWDRRADRWTLVTHDLPAVKTGRTYQLWLVTAKAEKIGVGTFNTDARGRAVVRAAFALPEADLAAIAITEEPTGGSPQPTGAILVAGAATR